MSENTLILAPEAFSPRVERMTVPAGQTLAATLTLACNDGLLSIEDVPFARVQVDGAPLELFPEGLDLVPREGQLVSVAVLPRGGSNNDARTALHIFVQIAAATVAMTGHPFLAAAISAAGTVAVNALFPIPEPQALGGQMTGALTDGSNRPRPREPMPLRLGAQRCAFDLAVKYYTQTVDNDVWLHAVFGIHYGPCVVTDVMIGETRLADYPAEDVQVEWALAPGPRASLLYPGRVEELQLDDKLEFEDDAWEVHATEPDAERIELDFVWPRGLRFNKDNGSILRQPVQMLIEWSPFDGPEVWTPAPLPPAVNYLGTTLPPGSYYIHERSGDAVRRSIGWDVPVKGRYKVRAKAWDPNNNDVQRASSETVWSAVRTIERKAPIIDQTLSLLYMRIRQSGDLSGTLPVITGVVEPICPIWNGSDWNTSAATSNQAALARWLLMGPAAAKPKSADRFHDSFADGYELIEANGWEAGVEVVGQMSQQDALELLGRAGRFSLYDDGRKLHMVTDWDRPVPRQLFTGRNAADYRTRKAFPDACHGVIVEFRNADKEGRGDELIVYADGYDASNAQLLEALRLDFECAAARAFKEGRTWLARRNLQVEQHSWSAGADGVYAAKGDRVLVRHAGPLIGLAEARVQHRRLAGGLVTGVRLDAEVEMTAGKAYAVDVRRADGVLTGVEVTTVAGRTRDLIFSAPLAEDDAPQAGDLLAFGEALSVTEDLELLDVQPAGDGQVRLQAAAYIGDILIDAETGEIPPLTTSLSDRRPAPTPRKVSINATPDGVELAFNVTVPRGTAVDSFAARWRRAPVAGETAEAWGPLRPLGATERRLVTPPIPDAQGPLGDAEAEYKVDLDLVTVMKGGERSAPLEIRGQLVRREVLAPDDVTAAGVTRTAPDGSKYAALAVSAKALDAGPVQALEVEISATGLATWAPAGQPLPANNPVGDFRGVLGGKTYDVRTRWRTADNWPSPWVTVTGVAIPAGSNISGGFAGEGGLARRDNVLLGALGHVFREGGVTPLTDALAVTSLGISAGFTGQGGLATKSAVNLASSEVTNKSLANLDSTANTKLGGIAAGATVGAVFGTNLLETSGGASATLASFKTSLGVASGIAGQSAWATTAIPTNAYEALPPGCAVGAMGDVRFTRNVQASGAANLGEVRVQGTTLYVPNRGKVTISQTVVNTALESSTANGTGRVYLVLGAADQATRFPGYSDGGGGGTGPIFPAKYDWTTGQWSAVDNTGALFPFTFAEDDAILATAYRASTASSGIDSLQSFVSEWRVGMPTDYADQTAANVAGGFTGQGPLATSVLTEVQVRGRSMGDYAGDAAANAAGFQPGDNYLDTSVFPNRVRVKKADGSILTTGLAPGTVQTTSAGTSSGTTWVVAARCSLTNIQSGSLVMASGDLFALPSNGSSLANSTGFQGRAKLYEATPGQSTFTTLDPARAIGDEWTFTVLNDGSNFAMPDFASSYDAPALRRLKSTPAADIVLLIKRDSGTNNVTNLGATIRPTIFGV